MNGLFEFALLTLTSLFAIVNPFGIVPAFLSMTPTDTPEQRIRMARMAALTAGGTLIVFAFAGRWIFKLLGITMPSTGSSRRYSMNPVGFPNGRSAME